MSGSSEHPFLKRFSGRALPSKLCIGLCLLAPLPAVHAQAQSGSAWWLEQKAPKGYVTGVCSGARVEQILLQALAGLAAQSVNEERGDELVWLQGGGCYDEWQKRTLARMPLKDRGLFDVWKLLARYRDSGLVQGFVVYAADQSIGTPYELRDNADLSLNVATTLAGMLGAVTIEAALEERASSVGLRRLADARELTPEQILTKSATKLNNKVMLLLDPKAANMRDFSIAHYCFVDFMTGEAMPLSLKWAEPLTPAVGWFCGDEFKHVKPISSAAHFCTVSNWATDVPFLSAGSTGYRSRRVRACDPRSINLKENRPGVAFLMSDGDNLGWMLNGFQQTNPEGRDQAVYWDNPKHGKFPMGWSAALGDLVDVAPVVIDRLAETQPAQTSITQFCGGYFYPDYFADNDSANREALLRRHAKQIAGQMQRTGAVTLTFICDHSDSAAAQEAMKIFAEEIRPLVGMLVMDYAPYNRMAGRVYWIPDGRGGEVPSVTARYSMWAGMKRTGAGGPREIAAAANKDSEGNSGNGLVAVHAWSQFENGENAPKLRGLDAVAQCIDLLDQTKLNVVTPEQMLWRVRYRHDPAGTQKVIDQWRPPHDS